MGSKNAGKVWKGFSTHDHTRSRKQLYRGTFWNHHHVSLLRPYPPVHDWRFLSSWGKPGTAHTKAEKAPTSKTESEGKMEEDWYCIYQQQKKKNYDLFMKRMEDDPIGMLFGRRWANWIDGAEAKLATVPAPTTQRVDVNGKSPKTYRDSGIRRTTISVKTSGAEDTAEQPHSGTVGAQSQEREYEIDPITNRKVPKPHSKSKTSPIAIVPSMTKMAPKVDDPSIPETSPESVSHMTDLPAGKQESFDIPVRRFVLPTDKLSPVPYPMSGQTSTKAEPESRKNSCTQQPKSWLAHEGFGNKQEAKPGVQSIHDAVGTNAKEFRPRIESALDRHVQANNYTVPEISRTALQYNPTENRAEDIDLLRSSDVRASAGLRGKAPKENDVEKRARQQTLEEEHESRGMHREIQLAQEVSAKRSQQNLESTRGFAPKEITTGSVSRLETLKQRSNEDKSRNTDWVNEISNVETAIIPKSMEPVKQSAEAAITEKANKIKAQIVPLKARLDAVKADYDALRQRWLDEKRRKEEKAAKKVRDMHEEEVNAQTLAMNAMETRGFEDTSKRNTTVADDIDGIKSGRKPVVRQLQSLLPGEGDMASNVHEFASRDRWYKQKAPHASNGSDAKLQQLAKDKALIQEVRGIYEDTYGTIDTNHRQSPPGGEVSKPLSTSKNQACTTSSTFLPHADSASPCALPDSPRPSIADLLQPWQAFHGSLMGNNPSSDPLAIIQKLFGELRQGQAFVRDRQASSQQPEVLITIQKLFSELRQIQAIIKNYRTNVRRISSPEELATMIQTVRWACNPSNGKPSNLAGNVAALGHEHSVAEYAPISNIDHSLESKPFRPLTIYRVLAFDPAKQEIVSSKATSLAPSQTLLPVDSLKLLNNPGKFFPDVMTLHNNGFTLVAGTSDTLVFQKPANTQEYDDSEREQVMKGIDYVNPMGVPNWIAGGCGPGMTREDTPAMRDQHHKGYPASVPRPSTSSTPPNPASPTSSTPKPSSTESATSEPAEPKPATPSQPRKSSSSNRVRREEAVFSGRSRGGWQETERRQTSKKHKRAEKAFKRSKLKNVLLTGIVTAACCYAVGVISQMMQH